MIKPWKRSGSALFHLLKTLETRPEAGRECGPQALQGWRLSVATLGPWGSWPVQATSQTTEGFWLHLLTLAKDAMVFSMLSWLHIHISLYVAFPNTPEELKASWATQGVSQRTRGQEGAGSPLHIQGPLGNCSTYLPNVFTVFLQRQFGLVEMLTILNVLYCF